jgi:hypothetical protein
VSPRRAVAVVKFVEQLEHSAVSAAAYLDGNPLITVFAGRQLPKYVSRAVPSIISYC